MRSPLLLALAFLAWLFLGFVFFKSSSSECGCGNEKAVVPVAPVKKKVTGPILFNYSDATPVLGEGWSALKSKYSSLENNQALEITGYYDKAETNNTSYANLGLARAHAAAKKFMPELRDDQIKKIGRVRNGSDKSNLFVATRFARRISSDRIQEVDGKALFYFPVNSTKKISDPEHVAYLQNVAKKVNAEGGKVVLTGHTDSDGDADANRKLGQGRADIIKAYLVANGLAPEKIEARSMGEDSPIADNGTPEGRARNRRTELEVIQ